MRKDTLIIGITFLFLTIITFGYVFYLAFRPKGVCMLYLVLPIILLAISLVFIAHGITANESTFGYTLWPFPPYLSAPPKQLSKHCVKCNRDIPSDANICPYCKHEYKN